MGAPRLVVVEGPDVGCEFTIPETGGGIGRGEDNVFQLSDLSVSRHHSIIERHHGDYCVIDKSSRNRTLVNGAGVTTHVLRAGDEITVGMTRLLYLPADGGAAVVSQAIPARVTMEI